MEVLDLRPNISTQRRKDAEDGERAKAWFLIWFEALFRTLMFSPSQFSLRLSVEEFSFEFCRLI
jgi:hypothetical protein